ncbi:hypothetical protein GWI33_002417 [Rhynchophorus ferrugineus]|uniref:Probable RNA polymerase II nuclear localization protein SLC7A6OS n=1 Tax=Rhynchophorus ferrugineus TaxID=354439 RepID=A0A834IX41_RHYFE|nr:hypothetical protein GWI33_002417 [Rhynchophorus ferrugineus]
MAALVRIKRRLDEDALESLILNCKRRKPNGEENGNTEELSTVFQLAGTSSQEEHIENVLKTHRLNNVPDLKDHFKKHDVNISDKLRKEIKTSSKNNRYRVVNCFRKTLSDTELENEADNSNNSEVTIFDLEANFNNDPIDNKNAATDESKFVYDFYYTSSDDFGEAEIGDYVSVYPLNDPLVFGSIRDNGLISSVSDDDSEDSNAEGNWRNDYPDEDDLESINEDDMVQAVNRLDIDDNLSSDSGEEEFIYSKDEEDYQDFEDDNKEDELRYGKLYARFKAKNKNVETSNLASDFYYGDIDEDEYHY